MPNIKIKNVAKGTIKTIDKTAIISGRMKNSFVRTKDKAEEELLPMITLQWNTLLIVCLMQQIKERTNRHMLLPG